MLRAQQTGDFRGWRETVTDGDAIGQHGRSLSADWTSSRVAGGERGTQAFVSRFDTNDGAASGHV
jgi:hypothetical protein